MLTDIIVGVAINLITGMAWNVVEGKTPTFQTTTTIARPYNPDKPYHMDVNRVYNGS